MANLPNTFTAWDYAMFCATLVVSMGIGVYFALKGDKQKTEGEYLMGGRKMPVIPVAISILFSFLSAILLLGTPAEMYYQGTEFYLSTYGMMLGFVIAGVFYVPLLYPLRLTSAFEYFERRFHSKAVRLLGTFLFILGQVIYMGIASYAPATALEAITGFPVWATLLVTGFVTTFYTTIGGMKAVVWTDVFQASIMLVGLIIISVQGTIKVGSVSRVWEVNNDWERIRFFNFDFDPRVRHTVFSLLIGSAVAWMNASGLSQAAVQRYSSLATLRQAQTSVIVNCLGVLIMFSLTCYCGIVMFAYYASQDCDLSGQRLVDNPNQLVPYFVMDLLAYPTIPGLFMSSLFAGALSSMSSSMNALAAITWEDALKPWLGQKLAESKRTFVIKVLVAFYGILSIGVSYAASTLDGTVVQATASFLGPPTGATTGMFLLGALFPSANKFGAFLGAIFGTGVGFWLAVGSYVSGIKNSYLDLPFPNGTCGVISNVSTMSTTTFAPLEHTTSFSSTHESDMFEDFYSISYLWTSTVALVACVVTGLVASFLFSSWVPKEEREVPPEYQIPVLSRLFCCLPPSWSYTLNCCRVFEDPETINARNRDAEILVKSQNDASKVTGWQMDEGHDPDKSSSDLGISNNAFSSQETIQEMELKANVKNGFVLPGDEPSEKQNGIS